ncbi:MAG: OmpA family protein [bacterium]|nr:OmpA family protein [bacterium]
MKRLPRSASLAIALVLTVALVGCQTASEHRTATGAIVGGLAGAGAGALIDSDNPGRGALIGAAAGAAVGAGIGHMLQKQKQSLDRIEDIETTQETIIVRQNELEADQQAQQAQAEDVKTEALRVRISSDVLFSVGSSSLSEQGAAKIGEVAAVLGEYPDSDCIVQGYTSSEGGDQANMELSERRATVVKNQLIASGIAANRLTAMGMGSSNPVSDNTTNEGRMRNRRVEIIIIPRAEAAQQ